jgi:hypothetical protein
VLVALLMGWLFLRGHGGSEELWFFGDRTTKQMSAEVAKVVPDKATQNVTSYNLGLIEQAYKNGLSQRQSLEKQLLTALERHDIPAEQFHTLAARTDEIGATATKNMLDVRFLMSEQLSDAQWRSLFPPPGASVTAK